MAMRNTIPGFGARLKSLRETAGLSQQGLADAAGTHPDSVVKLEGETRSPSFELVCRIADALGVTTDALRPTKRNSRKSADKS